eukprot:5426820-Prorocentrum_lima.AAC.1
MTSSLVGSEMCIRDRFKCHELAEGGSLLSRAGVPPDIIGLLGSYEHVHLHTGPSGPIIDSLN